MNLKLFYICTTNKYLLTMYSSTKRKVTFVDPNSRAYEELFEMN